MKKLLMLLSLTSLTAFSQIPCSEGKAGNYDCEGIDLQARISVTDLGAEEKDGRWLNDIWGWVDPETEREYALVGMTNGTSFVDITDPVNPLVLGVLVEHNSQNNSARTQHDGAKSVWRDIKVYKDHAYIVSEDPGHGVQVFDLTNLRDVVDAPAAFKESGHYDGVGNAHNIVINEETGFAYVVGYRTNTGKGCSAGGLHILDLSDPKNPTFAGCFDDDGYTHDAQCVVYQGPDQNYLGSEICFNSNEDEVVIVDVTDKGSPFIISQNGYDSAQYTHQGWLTEDHRFFLSNDELDERNFSRKTRTFIWDVLDLDSPTLIGHYEHGTKAIDHNLYTKGRYVYESNYTTGLRILDTTGIRKGSLVEVAYFDTYVSNDATAFSGNWSNYPYFPSGNIVVSDITNGLFILKMQSLFIAEEPQDEIACVGEHLNIPLIAAGEGNLSYQWQVDEGDGFQNIENFERYKNTTTTAMHAHTLELLQNGNQYRCIVSNDELEIISEPMILTVLDSPEAIFSYDLTSLDGTISFDNQSENAENYFWTFGDGEESMDENPTYKYQEEGLFEIILIASNGCTSDTLIQNLALTISDIEDSPSRINIYPTVAKDEIEIHVNNADQFEFELYSLQGRKFLSNKVTGGAATLSVASLSKGIYVLRILLEDKAVSRKIVIE